MTLKQAVSIAEQYGASMTFSISEEDGFFYDVADVLVDTPGDGGFMYSHRGQHVFVPWVAVSSWRLTLIATGQTP